MNKITVNAEALRNAMSHMVTSGQFPILEHALVTVSDNELTLTSTNMSLTVERKLPCENTGTGSFTLPIEKLKQVLTGLTGEVELETEFERVTLKQTRRRFRLDSLPPDTFPESKQWEGRPLAIDPLELRSAIERTEYAVSRKDFRPLMNSLWLTPTHVVGTTGNSLASVATAWGLTETLVIPQSSLSALVPWLVEGAICHAVKPNDMSANQFIITNPIGNIRTLLLNEKVMDWQRSIPKLGKGHTRFQVDDLIACLHRMIPLSTVGDKGAHVVNVIAAGDELTVRTRNDLTVYDSVPAQTTGEGFDVAIDLTLLLKTLKVGAGCTAQWKSGGELSAQQITFLDDGKERTDQHLIMPCRR